MQAALPPLFALSLSKGPRGADTPAGATPTWQASAPSVRARAALRARADVHVARQPGWRCPRGLHARRMYAARILRSARAQSPGTPVSEVLPQVLMRLCYGFHTGSRLWGSYFRCQIYDRRQSTYVRLSTHRFALKGSSYGRKLECRYGDGATGLPCPK